jgi:hypothetical protein
MPYASYTLPGGGTAYADGSYTAPSEIFPSPVLTYPFEQDQTHYLVRRRYQVLRGSYAPQALDTADSTYTTAYLVQDTPVGTIGADLLEIERTYSTIPAARNEFEDYAYEFPGASASISTISYVSLGGVTFCSTTGDLAWSSGVSAATGDLVGIKYVRDSAYGFIDGTTANYVFTGVERRRASGTNRIRLRPAPSALVSTTESISSASAANLTVIGNRSPETKATLSRVLVEYLLPGVTTGVTEPQDIQPEQAFRILNQVGQETNIVTATSIPTVVDYRAMIARDEEIVAEDGQVSRYRGNIYERRTRFVKAQ